jgi:DNA-3-methyladenine glycosylase
LPAKLAPLPREFYDRDPRKVARNLLGKLLIRREERRRLVGRIVETEAYLDGDPAAHSFVGRTERNYILWGPPGFSYVYFIYGNHFLFNVSCMPHGKAGGVLFRAVEPLEGLEAMALGRDLDLAEVRDLRLLTSGPGRVAEAFGITRQRDNGKDLTLAKSDLFVADHDAPRGRIAVTPRIGITKAAERPLRYIVVGNRFVSGKVYRG